MHKIGLGGGKDVGELGKYWLRGGGGLPCFVVLLTTFAHACSMCCVPQPSSLLRKASSRRARFEDDAAPPAAAGGERPGLAVTSPPRTGSATTESGPVAIVPLTLTPSVLPVHEAGVVVDGGVVVNRSSLMMSPVAREWSSGHALGDESRHFSLWECACHVSRV
jgi:hypothetical protein